MTDRTRRLPLKLTLMESEGLSKALGDVVRLQRKGKGWSQIQLAEHAGVSDSTIRNIETGRTPSAYKLHHVAAALGVHLGELYKEAERAVRTTFPEVGQFIAKAMSNRGLTVAQLARRMMAEEADVRRMLDGEAGPIMWGTAAHVLEIPPRVIEQLLDGQSPDDENLDSDLREWLARSRSR